MTSPHWPRAILHVDMDAFYASVEQRDRPELRGKPVIVAGDPKQRGVVSAASYEVRAYGVRSAMPTGKALRLCPHAIRVFPRMERYQEVSATVFEIFARFTPLIQAVSLDEAFLDVTASQRLHGDPVTIARKIRVAIKAETALTASVGVASCRIDAKIASDLDKPDGLTVISAEERNARLDPLPVSRIWGVGAVTNRHLEKLGILTIGQLRQWPIDALRAELGKNGSPRTRRRRHPRQTGQNRPPTRRRHAVERVERISGDRIRACPNRKRAAHFSLCGQDARRRDKAMRDIGAERQRSRLDAERKMSARFLLG